MKKLQRLGTGSSMTVSMGRPVVVRQGKQQKLIFHIQVEKGETKCRDGAVHHKDCRSLDRRQCCCYSTTCEMRAQVLYLLKSLFYRIDICFLGNASVLILPPETDYTALTCCLISLKHCGGCDENVPDHQSSRIMILHSLGIR
jgi:hypothetical protein